MITTEICRAQELTRIFQSHGTTIRAVNDVSFGSDRGFYPKASAQENLLFFADLAGVSARARRAEVSHVLSLVDLEAKASAPAHTLSRGQYQRLHIA